MIVKVANAVSVALSNEFDGGDVSYTYYLEEPEQKFAKPAFMISVVNPLTRWTRRFSYSVPSKIDEHGNVVKAHWSEAQLYKRTLPILVNYFPSGKEPKKQIMEVAERLYDCLEHLMVDGVEVTGEEMEMQITEGVLQFFVTYRFYTQKVDDSAHSEMMERIAWSDSHFKAN